MTLLPAFFILGVPKSGTSSVAAWLGDHPDVVPPREKETCFFADPESHIFRRDFNAANGIGTYRAAFLAETGARLTYDATPAYIYQSTALRLIPSLPTQPKCLIILRNPADQIRSVFQYYRDNWGFIPATMDFGAYLTAVRSNGVDFGGNELAERPLHFADYAPFLDPWSKALGPDRLRVITFDRLVADPKSVMRDLAEWLDLDPDFYETYPFPRENESYTPKSRALQAVNMRVRALLPKGRVYQAVRRLYRRLNTTKPDAVGRDETAALMAEFADRSRALGAAYALDVSAWLPPDQDKSPR